MLFLFKEKVMLNSSSSPMETLDMSSNSQHSLLR